MLAGDCAFDPHWTQFRLHSRLRLRISRATKSDSGFLRKLAPLPFGLEIRLTPFVTAEGKLSGLPIIVTRFPQIDFPA